MVNTIAQNQRLIQKENVGINGKKSAQISNAVKTL